MNFYAVYVFSPSCHSHCNTYLQINKALPWVSIGIYFLIFNILIKKNGYQTIVANG